MSTAPSAEWVVVGGGVVGLSAAWRLARAGHDVLLLEATAIGAGASTRAAGMLLPEVEAYHDPSVARLGRLSLALYPAFLADLEEDSGLAPGFRRAGCLVAAPEEVFGKRFPGLRPSPWGDVRNRCPGLGEDVVGAFLPEGSDIDPPRLVEALRRAASRVGVRILTGCPVWRIQSAGARWTRLVTPLGPVSGRHFLLAAGAWVGGIGGVPDNLGVTPVKGQLVEVVASPGLLPVILYGPDVYLCPKGDGRILVGATMERVGFDPAVTAGAVADLLGRGLRLFPPLATAAFQKAVAGFRPARAGGPLVGPIAENAWAAVGLYRSGILLAPWAAQQVVEGAGRAAG